MLHNALMTSVKANENLSIFVEILTQFVAMESLTCVLLVHEVHRQENL